MEIKLKIKKNERELDCHTLFDYGFNNYTETTICEKEQTLDKSDLNDIPTTYQSTNIVYGEDLNLLINKDETSNITNNISWKTDLNYPISKDSVIGTITYTVDGSNYSVNLLAGNDILPTNSDSISYTFYILVAVLIIILLLTIFTKKKRKKYKKEEKYFRHSFY